MPSKFDAIPGVGDMPQPDTAQTQTLDTPQGVSKWDDVVNRGKTDELLNQDTGFLHDLRNFAHFASHGLNRGVAEVIGFPVDSWNAAGDFLKNHPALAGGIEATPIVGAMAKFEKASGYQKIPAGGAESVEKLANKAGIPTSSPEQEGDTSAAGHWGDTLGEFAGANIPFVYGAPEKIVIGGVERTVPNIMRLMRSEKPFTEALHDLAVGAIGPGLGAIVGEEVSGPDHKDAGKAIGGVVGGLRLAPIEASLQAAKAGASWMHNFLGFGTGAKGKVAESLTGGAQDLPTAIKNVENVPPLSTGTKIPVDIKSKDEGLLALRRTVMAKDAQLSGDYRRMQKATAEAIKQDAKFSLHNFPTAYEHIDAKQKSLEDLINRRQMQAVEDSDRAMEQAFKGVSPNQIDANTVKNAYATTLRKQLLLARDDANAAVETKWEKVDKKLPVDMDAVYDEINTLKAEHKARPGQSAQRFPKEFVDRFYKDNGSPKFAPVSSLQDAIDLHSEVSQAMREESAKDAPNRVYIGYLSRLSDALQRAKESMPAAALPDLREANMATKSFHETFSRGPVGQVLGHDVPGAPDVFPGDTIRHFLSQGPAGIDNFNALMRAVAKRTGQVTKIPPSAVMPKLLRDYIRQDFYDNVSPNGVFNKRAAEQWMANNSGPLLHFEDMRKEFETAIQTQGKAATGVKIAKQALDDVRTSRAALFLKGDPGKLFNGAVNSHDKYAATKELLNFTKDDPTGRATEGLGQMALDNMMAESIVADKTSMDLQRISGTKINQWYEDNKGVVRALNGALPGIADRFKRIADTARYLEGFNVAPKVPQQEAASKVLMLRDVMARIIGANVFTKFGYRGGSIQTAAIGSQAFKQLAANLTPDQAVAIFRRAMVEPDFFKALTTEITEKNAKMQFRIIQPYMYSLGIPIMQPLFQDEEEPKKRAAQ
jgi:hypothetical protein